MTTTAPAAVSSLYADRLGRARQVLTDRGLDALVVTPSADLRYLTGYAALPMERLTALVLPSLGDAVLVVPELEVAAALASPVGDCGLQVRSWSEAQDPFDLVEPLLRGAAHVAVGDQMWAEKLLRLQRALPGARTVEGGPVLRELRMRKSADEVAGLRRAGRAIDTVHAQVASFLRPGRTEREVARDIADAILDSGHATVEFVIVGSGPNGASPHHEVSDRVIEVGDPVVVDIGGAMPDGYFSDSTRTYCVGQPDPDFVAIYDDLLTAQRAACDVVRPGITAEAVDAAARDSLTAAGRGELFIHRTGHGIGLECHEDPYIIEGNTTVLEPGMAFSIEPGCYVPGRWGARIEDIVVCTEEGAERLNLRPRELCVVPAS